MKIIADFDQSRQKTCDIASFSRSSRNSTKTYKLLEKYVHVRFTRALLSTISHIHLGWDVKHYAQQHIWAVTFLEGGGVAALKIFQLVSWTPKSSEFKPDFICSNFFWYYYTMHLFVSNFTDLIFFLNIFQNNSKSRTKSPRVPAIKGTMGSLVGSLLKMH